MDYQSEQDQNLRDTLGFDPGEEADETLTPLAKAAITSGQPKEKIAALFVDETKIAIITDPVNLFSIKEIYKGVSRIYHKYDPEGSRNFSPAIEIKLHNDGNGASAHYNGRHNSIEQIHIGPNHVGIHKTLSNKRVVNMIYKENKLFEISFGEHGGNMNYGFRQDLVTGELGYFFEPKLDALSVRGEDGEPIPTIVPPQLKYEIDSERRVKLDMSRNGVKTDEFIAPLTIDATKISEDMNIEGLLKDPMNRDVNIDIGALMPPFA